MSKRQNLRKQRVKLWKENPHCCFCGRLTILPENRPKGLKEHSNFPNMATIEHIFGRLHPRRREYTPPEIKRHVLACFECNNRRSREDCNINFPLKHKALSHYKDLARNVWKGLTSRANPRKVSENELTKYP